MYTGDMFLKWGIPTLWKSIAIDLPATAKLENKLGVKMPEDIGRILGLSVTVGTVDYDNTPLISAANSTNLWMELKEATSVIVDKIRLDMLVFNNASGTYQADWRYLPLNLPKNISLDQSIIYNPTSIASARILLNVLYMTPGKYESLKEQGFIKDTKYSG